MKTYVAHLSNFNLSDGIYYSSKDNYKSINKFSGLKEFESLDHKDTLIVLLPSMLVGSFPFKSNEKLSQQVNLANFISDIDSDIPSDVSQNEFLIYKNNGFVVNKKHYKSLNNDLSQLRCKILLFPDYFINLEHGKNRITELNERFLFSYEDGTGTSVDKNSVAQYIDFVKRHRINYEPDVFVSDKVILEQLSDFNQKKLFKLDETSVEAVSKLNNFYKFNFSIKNLFKKLSFTKFELYACLGLLVLSLLLPFFIIFQNNSQAQTYESEILNIFQKIDKNTKNVVTPKIQIDQLINQIPTSNQNYQSQDSLDFNNLDSNEDLMWSDTDSETIDELLRRINKMYDFIENTETIDIDIDFVLRGGTQRELGGDNKPIPFIIAYLLAVTTCVLGLPNPLR